MLSFINQLQGIVLNVLFKRRVVPLWIVALFALSGNSWAYDCSSQSDIPPEECEALLTLMETVDLVSGANTGGGGVILDGFLDNPLNWTTVSPCTTPELDPNPPYAPTGYFTGWGGVYCKNGHVERIGLNGDINSHLKLKDGKTLPDFCKTPSGSTLPNLWLLDLSGNNFRETSIPDFCLPEMKALYLTNSNLGGTIKFTMKAGTDSKPELKLMPKLNTLKLERNNLIGNIPKLNSISDSAEKVIAPVVLHVDYNKLTGIEHYPLWTYSSNNCSPSNNLGVPPNFDSPQKTAVDCKVTIKGFIFNDVGGDGQFSVTTDDKKIGNYPNLLINDSGTWTSVPVDKYGNFSYTITETGNPIQFRNVNYYGWEQTTPVAGSGNVAFSSTIETDYLQIAIGIRNTGTSSSGYGNSIKVTSASRPISGAEQCNGFWQQFTCASTDTTKILVSCSIDFGDSTFGYFSKDPNSNFVTDHFYRDSDPRTITVTGKTTDADGNNEEWHSYTMPTQLSVGNGNTAFGCMCDKNNAEYTIVDGLLKPAIGPKKPIIFIDSPINGLGGVSPSGKGICISPTGKLTDGIPGSGVTTYDKVSFLYNQGTVKANDLPINIITAKAPTHPPLANGINLEIDVSSIVVNEGTIQAGSGNTIIDHSYNGGLTSSIELKASDGGNLSIHVGSSVFNYNLIGSNGAASYNNGSPTNNGGNGGIASRSSDIRRSQSQSSDNDCNGWLNDNHLSSSSLFLSPGGHSGGNARGGKGGNVTISGLTVESFGTIRSGHGGDGRVYECNYNGNIAYAGEGGKVSILPEGTFRGYGVIDGSGGRILLEPVVIQGGSNFRIVNASEVVLFGGDGAQIKLNNLVAGAISATGDIILAVGQGGIVDLRGNNAKIFNSTSGKVKIYADTVLLDTGVTLADLANVTVEKYPAQILFAVNLQGTGTIKGNANATLPLAVTVQNVGPSSDTYTLSLTNPNNWQITGLPSSLTVDGLKSQVITLQVTLPANAVGSLVNDIVIRAVSNANATATSEMKVRLIADAQISASACTATYDLNTRTVTIPKVDVPVLDVITGKPSTDIAVFSAKLQQHLGVDDFSIVDNSFQFLSFANNYLPENARYTYNQDLYTAGGVLDFCVQVPSVVVIPPGIPVKGASKNYRVKLRQLAIQPNTFHVETITPITP